MTAPAAEVPAAVRAAACPADQLPQVAHALLVDLVAAVPAALSATVVTLTGDGPRLRPWASSGPAGTDLDAPQATARQGPAYLAAASGEVVVAADVGGDPRWVLPSPGPVRSVVATALPGAARDRAVLVVHGDGAALADPDAVAQVAAAVPGLAAAVAVVQARVETANLQLALTSNRTIGAAIGITMALHGLRYDDAAVLLRSLSNHTNTRLGDLAEEILLTGQLPYAPRVGRTAGSRR